MNNPNIEVVLHLVNKTLKKYFLVTSRGLIHANLLIVIHQFENSVRWKEFWFLNEEGSEINSEEVTEEVTFDKEGFRTNLRLKYKI